MWCTSTLCFQHWRPSLCSLWHSGLSALILVLRLRHTRDASNWRTGLDWYRARFAPWVFSLSCFSQKWPLPFCGFWQRGNVQLDTGRIGTGSNQPFLQNFDNPVPRPAFAGFPSGRQKRVFRLVGTSKLQQARYKGGGAWQPGSFALRLWVDDRFSVWPDERGCDPISPRMPRVFTSKCFDSSPVSLGAIVTISALTTLPPSRTASRMSFFGQLIVNSFELSLISISIWPLRRERSRLAINAPDFFSSAVFFIN